MNADQITINPEFKNAMKGIGRANLEKSILKFGILDPLIVWDKGKKEKVLIDGHCRYEVCKIHDIAFSVVEIEFDNDEEAYNWIIKHQLDDRRNATPEEISVLRGRQYKREKKKHGGDRKSSGHYDHLMNTRKKIADEHKVEESTIRRDAKFAEAVDAISENVGPEAEEKILSGKKISGLSKKDVVAIAKEEPEKQKSAFAQAHFSTATVECNTPKKIINRVLEVLKTIDLDPCSNSHKKPNVPAKKHYTKSDNGLTKEWGGKVFMNPPYGTALPKWVKHVHEQYQKTNIKEAIVLIPSRTDTAWFRMLREYPRCFIWGRLKFSGAENTAPFPSMAVYLGNGAERFCKAFGDIGDIYQLVKK